jgi:hypothetical protein
MNPINYKQVKVVLPSRYEVKSIQDLRNEYDKLSKDLNDLPFEPEKWEQDRLSRLEEATQAPAGFTWKRDLMTLQLFLEPD